MPLFLFKNNHVLFYFLILSFLLLISDFSLAQALPWENPIGLVQTSLSGPVATGVAVIGFFVSGMILVFGQDLSGFGRTVVMIILAVSFLKLGSDFITALFG